MTASGAERKLCLYYACLRSLCIAQKHLLGLGPYFFIMKKSKELRGEWNEDCTSLKQIPGMLGREQVCSGGVHRPCFLAALYDLQVSPGFQCMEWVGFARHVRLIPCTLK